VLGIKRKYINIKWDKMQVIENGITVHHVHCMKEKWNIFREDWGGKDLIQIASVIVATMINVEMLLMINNIMEKIIGK